MTTLYKYYYLIIEKDINEDQPTSTQKDIEEVVNETWNELEEDELDEYETEMFSLSDKNGRDIKKAIEFLYDNKDFLQNEFVTLNYTTKSCKSSPSYFNFNYSIEELNIKNVEMLISGSSYLACKLTEWDFEEQGDCCIPLSEYLDIFEDDFDLEIYNKIF